jgi:hypothetical protein
MANPAAAPVTVLIKSLRLGIDVLRAYFTTLIPEGLARESLYSMPSEGIQNDSENSWAFIQ